MSINEELVDKSPEPMTDETAAAPDDIRAVGDADKSESDEARRLCKLEHEVANLQEQLLRGQAELINFRRRAHRDRLEQIAHGRAALLGDLLVVVDDFERAVAVETESVEAYRDGVRLTLKSLFDRLRGLGVERLTPLGERFDPKYHEAVDRAETTETKAGHVLEVFQAGYVMDNRLVRPARVSVATAPAVGGAEDEGHDTADPINSNTDDQKDFKQADSTASPTEVVDPEAAV